MNRIRVVNLQSELDERVAVVAAGYVPKHFDFTYQFCWDIDPLVAGSRGESNMPLFLRCLHHADAHVFKRKITGRYGVQEFLCRIECLCSRFHD